MITRRTVVGAIALSAAAQAQQRRKPVEWKPKLGILGRYTPANVQFASAQGFANMILDNPRADQLGDADIEAMRSTLRQANVSVSTLQVTQNHISPDPAQRERENAYFAKAIELAGKLGAPYVGAMSGKDPAKPFQQQIDEIVRVYNEKYFPACERAKVRIVWEPWPEGPNLATSPVGYEALFKAFGDSPHVGIQFDPSHFVRQFMDPMRIAREYVDRIHDVHLKDTEILTDRLQSGGINPPNRQQWWRYRIPGMGQIRWNEFFSILQDAGYHGAMSIEHEDALYGADNNPGPDFSDEYKVGFVMGKRYLSQYVP
jgi:sugar phosphate isomerase/epimerase